MTTVCHTSWFTIDCWYFVHISECDVLVCSQHFSLYSCVLMVNKIARSDSLILLIGFNPNSSSLQQGLASRVRRPADPRSQALLQGRYRDRRQLVWEQWFKVVSVLWMLPSAGTVFGQCLLIQCFTCLSCMVWWHIAGILSPFNSADRILHIVSILNVPIEQTGWHIILINMITLACFVCKIKHYKYWCFCAFIGDKWNEWGFKPSFCTYRLSWARKTSWGWWDEWDTTAFQTQNSKFEPWRSEVPHNIDSLRVSGKETFCFFEAWRPEWGSNPRFPTFQLGSLNHRTRAPALLEIRRACSTYAIPVNTSHRPHFS